MAIKIAILKDSSVGISLSRNPKKSNVNLHCSNSNFSMCI